AGVQAGRLQMVVARARDRRKRAVPNEEVPGAMMVITKKALHRRTVLRGLGTTLALPLLDAMVPALAKAQSTKSPTRLSIAYVPNGIMMDQWTPDTVGANFKLKPIMEPLAAFQDRMLVIS